MNDLTIRDNQLPAHLAGFSYEANSDLAHGVNQGFPILSYKGKSWHLVAGGNAELIVNDEGEPVTSVEVVILKANPNIGKTYYPDGYEEGSNERPACYSNDSVAPAADSTAPQAKKCAICPHNQFGSKITENGARGKACSDFRRLAVAPSGDLERAMLLRVPAASLKELLAYADLLSKRRVPYQALVTRIGFDHDVAYPKLKFKMQRWLEAGEVDTVREMMASDLVETITALNAPSFAAAEDDDEMGAPPAHVQGLGDAPAAAPAAAAARRKAVASVREVEAAIAPAKASAAPAKPAQADPVRKATGFGGAPKKVTGEEVGAALAPAAVVEKAEPVTVLAAGAMSDLDAALAEFDDD